MGTKIYGIGSCELPDHAGETVMLDGIDTSKLTMLTDEHATANSGLLAILGAVTGFKKINTEKDCTDAHQKKCWKEVNAPFIYFTGELADEEDHPNAKAAAALLRFQEKHPDFPLRVRASIEGSITKRSNDQKTLEKTVATGFALTAKPCNPKCLVFVEDAESPLEKSDSTMMSNQEPATSYVKALRDAPQRQAFDRGKEVLVTPDQMRDRIETLRSRIIEAKSVLQKSLDDYNTGKETEISCQKCNAIDTFFKHSKNISNRCRKCGHPYSMGQLFRAMDK